MPYETLAKTPIASTPAEEPPPVASQSATPVEAPPLSAPDDASPPLHEPTGDPEAELDVESLRSQLLARDEEVSDLRREIKRLTVRDVPIGDPQQQSADEIKAQLLELNDALLLQQVGIYEYHHPLENAEMYKDRLRDLQERIKQTVKDGNAIMASDMFSFNNSLAKGRKMTADFSKLMLRAFNAEADNCVRSLRAGTVATAKKRLQASVETIARLGSMMEMRVSPEYGALRVEELELTADYLFKVQEEREAARDERERLREERKAEQELAAERERLDKEKAHYENALRSLETQGKVTELADLKARLIEIDAAIEMNDYRTANIRAGYVYVISNIGTFGNGVVKIGLTRRLEPMDRIRELGDASVPFPFDVHALYFSNDAITLENELHAAFAERRLNHVNLRREFFFATPQQVRDVLAEKVGSLLEFTEAPEATQFFQSQSYWPMPPAE